MAQTSSLELPFELKQKIERVARERNEAPAALLSYAIDALLSAEEAQIGEIRRRDSTDSGGQYANREAVAKLDSFRPSRRSFAPK